MSSDSLSPVPFAQFQTEILTLYGTNRIATYRKMRQVLEEFSSLCPTTDKLDPVAIASWMSAHRDRAAWTHRSLLSTLRSACSYGDFKRYLRNPFGFRPLDKWIPADELEEAEDFRRHRSAEEVRRVLARADLEALTGDWDARRLRAAIYAWAFTGAGKLEVLGLRVCDLDLPGRLIRVRSHSRRRLKTGARHAVLPVAEPLAVVLGDWLPRTGCEWLFPHKLRTGPWFHGRPGKRPLDEAKALGDRAGVEGLTILDFRHTIGTLAEGWGIGELMLQRLLRHARRQTQQHYRHPDLELMRQAAEKIRF
jgi:integrase